MNKTKLIMIIMSATVICACGSNEGAQDLHDRLVAAGKLEITEVKGLSINSYVDTDASLQEPNELALGEDDTVIGSETADGTATAHYVTFKEGSFTVEKNGKEVLNGEWQAIDDSTILVDMNGGNKELNVELNGSKITLADNVEEYSDSTSSSASSGNLKKPQSGTFGENNGTYPKPGQKTCINTWGYTYGYNPANGKYDYHYGSTQQCH